MTESSEKPDVVMYFPWKIPANLPKSPDENPLPEMDNPSNEPLPSSSIENPEDSENSDDSEDYNYDNFIKNWKYDTDSYINDVKVRLVRDVRQEIKVISSKTRRHYVPKTTHKILKPVEQNLQNADLDKKQTYLAEDYENVCSGEISEDSEISDGGSEDYNYENFIKTSTDVASSYTNDAIVRLVQDVQKVFNVILSNNLSHHVAKTRHKILKPKEQNLQNATLNKEQTYLDKDYEEVVHHSSSLSSASADRPVAHKTFEISSSSNYKTHEDLIDYLSKCNQSPDNLLKIDKITLQTGFYTWLRDRKETNKTFLEIVKRPPRLIENINLLTPLIKFIEKDMRAIEKQKLLQSIQVNHRLKSLNRQIWIYFKIIRENIEECDACVEKLGKLEMDTSNHLSNFLNSDLGFRPLVSNPEQID